jgi:lipopolysaccharide/colanic/teichoic acid biosynthesis glycosyltransferase
VQDPASLLLKRVLDVGLSAVLLVVHTVFAVSPLAVRLVTTIFYPWRVIGRNNRRFVGWFRTMVVNADELKSALERNGMAGPCFKMSDRASRRASAASSASTSFALERPQGTAWWAPALSLAMGPVQYCSDASCR